MTHKIELIVLLNNSFLLRLYYHNHNHYYYYFIIIIIHLKGLNYLNIEDVMSYKLEALTYRPLYMNTIKW
jgi:hypothetical protein